MASFNVKHAGIWKRPDVWVKDASVWKKPKQVFVKDGGVWKPLLWPTLTFIDLAVVAGQSSAINYGNFVAPTDGLMLVCAHAFGANSRQGSTVSIGGTIVTPSGRNISDSTRKWAVACLAVTAGTYGVTFNLSGSNGANSRNGCGVWLLTNYLSATAISANMGYASNSLSASVGLNLGAYGCAVYLAGEGVRGTPVWSGASTDVTKTATVDGFAQTFVAASKLTAATVTGDVETATWASSNDHNYVVGGAWQ
ncbi:hypothetical protein [Mesorhizobium sp.]|uniref:hypothetical protein n=1 Tax=Mesorhizobium sp. TaxID=1871066 RepID=UPI000FE6D34D|nr:hypothetical protein [Mesorhizobium sp.]RWD70882.1 MAG: hypothetical protein EOS37_13275 [Mesorhizobium sp.]